MGKWSLQRESIHVSKPFPATFELSLLIFFAQAAAKVPDEIQRGLVLLQYMCGFKKKSEDVSERSEDIVKNV